MTHQPNIAEELSDRAIIHKGEIIAQEPTDELIQQFLAQRTFELENNLDQTWTSQTRGLK